jgi:chemotaxis methyl-accepting protein methylase/Tfp pilus assembly protein PilF
MREIAQLIEATSGFVIGHQSLEALGRFVGERVRRGGFAGVERYVDYLRRHPDSEEWRHLLSRITVKESYLFRSHAQFEALADTILDEIVHRRRDRHLRIWCAGCARGEEAATLAIVLADHPVVGSWRWSVLATDVDEAALSDARRGLYGKRAVERVPPATLERHFVRRGDQFELVPELRRRIEYRRLNLADEPFYLGDERFDVIFLRNVLIYFKPELQRRVIELIEVALSEHGVLFLGPSESLLHLGTKLQAEDLGECFCYRRRQSVRKGESTRAVEKAAVQPMRPATEAVAPPGLSEDHEQDVPTYEARLESMIEALEKGENRRAAAGLAALRHEFPEKAAARVLEGVAVERCGDPEQATLAYRAALYLAPEMDEVRFLLARALERQGRSQAAAREYRTALTGLGPAGGQMTAILRRLGFPDHQRMSALCRKFFADI